LKSKLTKSELLGNLEKVLDKEQELEEKHRALRKTFEDSLYLTKEQVEKKNSLHYEIFKAQRTRQLIQRLLDEELHQ
jgi:predicted transcriptional regulator